MSVTTYASMTDDELIAYYASLLIIQYANLPNASGTIRATAELFIMNQLPTAVMNAYDLSTAVGVQLDVLGKYVGASRMGVANGLAITLDDTDYRTLIKLKLVQNNSGSSLAEIQSQLASAFPGQIFISDSTDMSLNYLIIETLGSQDLLDIIVTGGYLPRPMAVAVSVVVVPSIDFPFFAFYKSSNPSAVISGFNFYGFYDLHTPWLGAT